MKALVISLFLSCFMIYCCSAQVLENDSEPTVRKKAKPQAKQLLYAVTFITSDTCNLTINSKDYGVITDNKTIKLPLGKHNLFFENLETGQVFKDPIFNLTREKLVTGKINYPVSFK